MFSGQREAVLQGAHNMPRAEWGRAHPCATSAPLTSVSEAEDPAPLPALVGQPASGGSGAQGSHHETARCPLPRLHPPSAPELCGFYARRSALESSRRAGPIPQRSSSTGPALSQRRLVKKENNRCTTISLLVKTLPKWDNQNQNQNLNVSN